MNVLNTTLIFSKPSFLSKFIWITLSKGFWGDIERLVWSFLIVSGQMVYQIPDLPRVISIYVPLALKPGICQGWREFVAKLVAVFTQPAAIVQVF